jgi:hypothetical protein
MASLEEAISSGDPEVIKKRRSTIQRTMTTVRKNLGRLLAKSAGKIDHEKIQRLQVQSEHVSLKKYEEDFKIIHEAYQQYREPGKDETEEDAMVEKQEQETRTALFRDD